ncbi:MAG: V-type ATP synthase subunit A [Candidatus Heimdallarchaeota archaeon]
MSIGRITRIIGPVVFAEGLRGGKKNHLVLVGEKELLGEIVQIKGGTIIIQVYEETSSLSINEPVIDLKHPLTVRLGPGLLSGVFDGIQRPLERIKANALEPGMKEAVLPRSKQWHFIPQIKPGDKLHGGESLGVLKETPLIDHHVLVPPQTSGRVKEIVSEGDYSIDDVIAKLVSGEQLYLYHDWPVRVPRPYRRRISTLRPFITGQRILDFFFPVIEGGTAIIPGGFGTGKTILERTLAKHSSTDIMVLTLCGERGNETIETLESFRTLEDPKTGHPMSERTCIIANTSNMPVAAREASIYSGVTIAEFYRDMGYRVSMLADSTSRWAEALREISGRLEEIPGEEGYPSYLPKLIGQFYERGGSVETLGGSEGSLTIVGAVSPQAGDFSEPVTQYSLRVANALWALDTELARSRHYPAVNWHLSFTRYTREVILFMKDRIANDWGEIQQQLQEVMQTEEELERIVRLLGKDTLSESQKGLLLTAELIKEGFLQQNAFSEFDAFCSSEKTYHMAKTILTAHDLIQQKVSNQNYIVEDLQQTPWVAEIKRMKERDLEGILHLRNQLFSQF